MGCVTLKQSNIKDINGRHAYLISSSALVVRKEVVR